MEVKAQFVQGQFAARFVNFGEFVDAHDEWQMTRLLLNAPYLLYNKYNDRKSE